MFVLTLNHISRNILYIPQICIYASTSQPLHYIYISQIHFISSVQTNVSKDPLLLCYGPRDAWFLFTCLVRNVQFEAGGRGIVGSVVQQHGTIYLSFVCTLKGHVTLQLVMSTDNSLHFFGMLCTIQYADKTFDENSKMVHSILLLWSALYADENCANEKKFLTELYCSTFMFHSCYKTIIMRTSFCDSISIFD